MLLKVQYVRNDQVTRKAAYCSCQLTRSLSQAASIQARSLELTREVLVFTSASTGVLNPGRLDLSGWSHLLLLLQVQMSAGKPVFAYFHLLQPKRPSVTKYNNTEAFL